MMSNLKRRGIIITRTENETVITNKKYPQMFLAAKLIYDAEKTLRSNKDKLKTGRRYTNPQYIRMLNYRIIEYPFKEPGFSDFFDPLTIEEKELVNNLFGYCRIKKLNEKFWHPLGIRAFEFAYKKETLFMTTWVAGKEGFTGLKIRIPEPGMVEHDLLLKKIDELDNAERIKDLCINNIPLCTYCSNGCMKSNDYKKNWMILGRLPLPKLIKSCDKIDTGINNTGVHFRFELNDETLAIAKTLVNILTGIY